ncbi:MAG: tetratricopeptide repeat protein [Alphaproteobacteria bacterium]|nr:tetratricopeptide repeat protein [Alphaproteobacteria bacterium]
MSSSQAQTEEQQEVPLEEALKLAQGHHQQGNYILAERTYRDILKAVPDHFPTTQFLGVLLYQSGDFKGAKEYLEIAVNTEPENAHCLNNYGGVLARLGDHEKALEMYDKALEIDPNYRDALNNKSNALWGIGDYKGAEKVSRKILENAPNDLVALNNLGMILAKQVKFEESLDIWEEAAQKNPEEPMIWINWGNTLREMGNLKESKEKCQKAVELAPKSPEALNNLANALRDLGKVDEAIELYKKATEEKPNYHEAHYNLAVAYGDNDRYYDAIVAARYAVAFKEDFIEAYSPLSKGLCEMAEYEQAHMAAQKAIHLDPTRADSYLDLADVLLKLEQYDDSEAAMQEALKHEPDSARAFMKLSEIREKMNNFEGAMEAIDKAIEMSPDMAALWVRKGLICYVGTDVAEGIKYFDKALQLQPGWVMAMQYKAEMLISLNRNEEAEKLVRDILAKTKKIPATYSTLVSLKRFTSEDDPDFQDMKALEDTAERFGAQVESVYHFSMSEAYEQMKDYDKAFKHLKKANDLKHARLPNLRWRDIDFHEVIKNKYTPEFIEQMKGQGYESDMPVFIVGMPRSGTTLTEQIISSHPEVFGAGELPDLGQVYKIVQRDQEATVASLGEEYVRLLKERDLTGKAKRVTDKMPANYMYIGFIKSILPNAKIIHCRRNPIDTCLSCYKQNFARGQHWSYNLEDLAEQYQRYLGMMQYWRDVMPGEFLEIDYEDTVGNFEEQARKLIDFVGLEWDDACLEPHKQKRAVLTASKAQVTKPVYKTSVEKWRRYEDQLQPLVSRLLPDQAKS